VNTNPLFDLSNRRRLFWRLQAVGWAGTLVVSVGMVVYLSMRDALVLTAFRSAFGLAITSFALRPVYQRVRRSASPYHGWRLALLATCCLVAGLVDAGLMSEATRWIDAAPAEQVEMRQFLTFSLVARTVLYGFWSILYFGIHYWLDTQQQQLRAARAEAALRAAELQMLRSQINPHFLFNALNSILASTDQPRVAQKITLALADYLRFSLQQRGETERLGVEVSALESYLQVEKFRFEESLEYRVEATASALETVVPVAMIQPLLENALKYGVRSPIRPLRITIRACIEGETLAVSVSNSGHWIEPGEHSSTGIGLANLRRRLQLLYGTAASMIHESSPGEVTIRISLPVARA